MMNIIDLSELSESLVFWKINNTTLLIVDLQLLNNLGVIRNIASEKISKSVSKLLAIAEAHNVHKNMIRESSVAQKY